MTLDSGSVNTRISLKSQISNPNSAAPRLSTPSAPWWLVSLSTWVGDVKRIRGKKLPLTDAGVQGPELQHLAFSP